MPKINRPDINIQPFALNAQDFERTVFGGQIQSDEIADNITSDFLRGWGIVGVNDIPTRQDFNALGYTLGALISHLYQEGLSPWRARQEYNDGALTRFNGLIYQSLSDNNIGNQPDATPEKWVEFFETSINGYTLEGFPYELVTMGDRTTRVIRVFGSQTLGDGEKLTITLPGEVANTNYIGVSGSVDETTDGRFTFVQSESDHEKITLAIKDGSSWVAGTLSFLIEAQLMNLNTPPAPKDIYGRSPESGVVVFRTTPF